MSRHFLKDGYGTWKPESMIFIENFYYLLDSRSKDEAVKYAEEMRQILSDLYYEETGNIEFCLSKDNIE